MIYVKLKVGVRLRIDSFVIIFQKAVLSKRIEIVNLIVISDKLLKTAKKYII